LDSLLQLFVYKNLGGVYSGNACRCKVTNGATLCRKRNERATRRLDSIDSACLTRVKRRWAEARWVLRDRKANRRNVWHNKWHKNGRGSDRQCLVYEVDNAILPDGRLCTRV
jgi:hypothetical protein